LRKLLAVCIYVAISAALVAQQERVTICHIPNGDVEKAQTITVAEAAVPAHEAHGDFVLGSCEQLGPSYVSLGVLFSLAAAWELRQWLRRKARA